VQDNADLHCFSVDLAIAAVHLSYNLYDNKSTGWNSLITC